MKLYNKITMNISQRFRLGPEYNLHMNYFISKPIPTYEIRIERNMMFRMTRSFYCSPVACKGYETFIKRMNKSKYLFHAYDWKRFIQLINRELGRRREFIFYCKRYLNHHRHSIMVE